MIVKITNNNKIESPMLFLKKNEGLNNSEAYKDEDIKRLMPAAPQDRFNGTYNTTVKYVYCNAKGYLEGFIVNDNKRIEMKDMWYYLVNNCFSYFADKESNITVSILFSKDSKGKAEGMSGLEITGLYTFLATKGLIENDISAELVRLKNIKEVVRLNTEEMVQLSERISEVDMLIAMQKGYGNRLKWVRENMSADSSIGFGKLMESLNKNESVHA